MIFNDHSKLAGRHALLNPSGYNWINYSDTNFDQLRARYSSQYAQTIGTIVHEFAQKHIKYGIKLSKSDRKHVQFYLRDNGIPNSVIDMNWIFENLLHYVNDAIGFRLEPEVVLYYSDICFGTADAIRFDTKTNMLRIHDLKTGRTPAHMEQLDIYAALFCLEYKFKPSDIDIELRLYQSDEVIIRNPEVNDILPIMDKIITFDKYLNNIKEEDR